jgi:multidrug efflux pump
MEADGFASREYLGKLVGEAADVAAENPDVEHIFAFTGMMGEDSPFVSMGLLAPPWNERSKTTAQIISEMREKLEPVAGLRKTMFPMPTLPTPGQGMPVEFVIRSTADTVTIAEVGEEIAERAMATNKFFMMNPSLRVDRPEGRVEIDRDKAALMGVDMAQLTLDLSALLAGAEVNRYAHHGRSYKVITQADRPLRLNPQQLENYYTRTTNGELVPLATLVTISERTVPRAIGHFQQLNANILSGVPRPGVSQGEALAILQEIATEVMPAGFQIDYAGQSRQYVQEGAVLVFVFLFALILIYLLLAALFESFRDPLVILVTVPMSISGALLFLVLFNTTNTFQLTNFPGMTLNIYTQVGLVTLIGVISKHGILMVDFANKAQLLGMSKREAIEEAASIRLRPILMTTAALVMAMIPLLTAAGPAAAARFSLGLVIAAGMTIGTLFTLFVVPAMYLYIGSEHRAAEAEGEGETAGATGSA